MRLDSIWPIRYAHPMPFFLVPNKSYGSKTAQYIAYVYRSARYDEYKPVVKEKRTYLLGCSNNREQIIETNEDLYSARI